ncbi:hypothetical protein L208DRAFT_1521153, partial [Tricholoma matsutake]
MLEMQTGGGKITTILLISMIPTGVTCIKVYLDSTGTAVRDFKMLLTAMDDSIDYYFQDPTFLTVTAIFRATSLLQFQKMLDFAQKYLNHKFS